MHHVQKYTNSPCSSSIHRSTHSSCLLIICEMLHKSRELLGGTLTVPPHFLNCLCNCLISTHCLSPSLLSPYNSAQPIPSFHAVNHQSFNPHSLFHHIYIFTSDQMVSVFHLSITTFLKHPIFSSHSMPPSHLNSQFCCPTSHPGHPPPMPLTIYPHTSSLTFTFHQPPSHFEFPIASSLQSVLALSHTMYFNSCCTSFAGTPFSALTSNEI